MKKFYLAFVALMLAVSGFASHREIIDGVAAGRGKVGAGFTVINNTISAKATEERDWQPLDEMGTMVDDILPALFDVDVMEYPVTVEEDQLHPGYYRIVNPWMYHPMRNVITRFMGGTLALGDDVVIELDATDPDCVVMPFCEPGVDDGDGEIGLGSLLGMMDYVSGISPVKAAMFAGKLENDCIVFDQPTSLIFIQGANTYTANMEGKFALILPGGELPVNYDVTVDMEEDICPEDGVYHLWADCDERVPELRYGISRGCLSRNVAEIMENGETCYPGDDIEISVSGLDGSHVYAIVATVNEDGDWEEYDYIMLHTLGDSDTWEYAGKARMTEGFLSSYYENKDGFDAPVETFEVDVERHKSTPGYYRLVNPYKRWSVADDWELDHDHNHYLYINAVHPENVYIEPSALGISSSHGEYSIKSNFSEYVDVYGYEATARSKSSEGRLIGDEITFGAECGILLHYSTDLRGSWWYVNVHSNPEFDLDQYKTDPNYNVSRFVPGDFCLDLSTLNSGVESVGIDASLAAPVDYYNLQGIRVDNPGNGFFLRRQGDQVKKVIR